MPSRHIPDLIRTHFPEVTWDKIEFFDQGWDHAVAILDDRLVFRAPKREPLLRSGRMLREARFLNYLHDKVPVRLPHYKYLAEDGSVGGYEMLKGEEFSPELVSSLTEAEADSAARQLAEFLTLLHRLAAEIAVSYGIADSRDEHSRDMLDKAVKLVSPRLSAEENAYMLWNLSRLEAVLRTSRPIVPIHLDLGYEHILYDRSCNQVNVIDFGDLSLGDPAYDFVGFYDFDDSFLNLVYGYYAGFKDETLLRRAKVYYDCFPISMMKDALDGYPVDFEYAYNLFDRKRRKSLMDGYGDPSY